MNTKEEQMREQFEAWAIEEANKHQYQYMSDLLNKRSDGEYEISCVASAWMGYQAALNSLEGKSVPEGYQLVLIDPKRPSHVLPGFWERALEGYRFIVLNTPYAPQPPKVVDRVRELERLLNEINNWLVCAAIATPADMMQSAPIFQKRIDAAMKEPNTLKRGE